MRHRTTEEYQRYSGEALSPQRLAQLWIQLPERERLSFCLSLTEDLCSKVIELTAPQSEEDEPHDNRDSAPSKP